MSEVSAGLPTSMDARGCARHELSVDLAAAPLLRQRRKSGSSRCRLDRDIAATRCAAGFSTAGQSLADKDDRFRYHATLPRNTGSSRAGTGECGLRMKPHGTRGRLVLSDPASRWGETRRERGWRRACACRSFRHAFLVVVINRLFLLLAIAKKESGFPLHRLVNSGI